MARKPIPEEKREEVRALRRQFPRMTYRELAARSGVNDGSVWTILNPSGKKIAARVVRSAPPVPVSAIPAATVQQPDSIIRPIPLSRLMAGR